MNKPGPSPVISGGDAGRDTKDSSNDAELSRKEDEKNAASVKEPAEEVTPKIDNSEGSSASVEAGSSEETTSTSPAVTTTIIGVSKIRTKRDESKSTNIQRFCDFGEFGFYDGGFNVEGKRHGHGKMMYDSGNYYEGTFVDDKFHGDHGIYRWYDGDEQEGPWLEGERHGKSVFRSAADGVVEYCVYDKGKAVGEGVTWSADRQVAHKMFIGRKINKISLDTAEEMARDMFDLPVPEPTEVSSQLLMTEITPPSKSIGLLGRLFATRREGSDGTLFFKDYGDWGSYEGEVDASGNRQGTGRMNYDSGNYYQGGFVDDKFHGEQGTYHWFDEDEYIGEWKDGERNGKGSFKKADGTMEYSMYEKGSHVGDGVTWSADRQTAHKVLNGEKKGEISLPMAEKLARDMFDLPVPEPSSQVSS
ncbi:hypothetical protein ACHAXR_012528, partial [Thalassiosira sp. AJA248-18]